MGSGQENITVEPVNKNTIKEKHIYNKVYFRTYKLLKGGSHYILNMYASICNSYQKYISPY
jgi:hypothetical protein